MSITALDLFAGTGWGVACQRLGITEHGVEIMPEARASREAAGMSTIYADVWDGIARPSLVPAHDLLIASPPCQTFSVAGKGAGRQALDDVLRLVPLAADPRADLRAAGADLDDRTALVLTPLAYAVRYAPTFIALEQVPAVLPVWHAIADQLQALGYSTDVGILNAEQYGVPQTRRRAILVARRDGEPARLPVPTHSRYYSRDPQRLDDGVLPWVSMAEALGWTGSGLAGFPRAADRPGDAITLDGADVRRRDLREFEQPAPTVTEKARSWKAWGFTDRPAVTVGNAVGRGLIGGSGAKAAVVRAIEDGSFIPSEGDGSSYAAATRITPEEAAVLQSYPPYPEWVHERPAPTVVGTRRSEGGMLIGRQLDDDSRRDVGGHQSSVGLRAGMLPGVRVSGAQAATLQTYPAPFPFQGTKTKQFLQIGNAVPPLLAEHILRAITE